MPHSPSSFTGSSRIHIGLGTRHLDDAIRFYSILFDEAPTKQEPGYAKFEPAQPLVNLSLSSTDAQVDASSLPLHYGVQVKTEEAVLAARDRFEGAGLTVELEENTTCCYAVQTKVWVKDPDGNAWEFFVVLEDASERASEETRCCEETCCSSETPGA